jgi:hypothetical protein
LEVNFNFKQVPSHLIVFFTILGLFLLEESFLNIL